MSARRLAGLVLFLATSVASTHAQDSYQRYLDVFESSSRPVEALEQAVGAHGRDAWVHHFLSRARMEARDLAGARTAIAEALRLAPNQPFHHETLGQVELRAGDTSAAAAAFRAAASHEERPEPKAWMNEQATRVEKADAELASVLGTAWTALFTTLLAGAAGFVAALRWSRR